MGFAAYRKTLKLKKIKYCTIPIEMIKCQYNPDYENVWSMVSDGSYDIEGSPHYKFLQGEEDYYIRMHKLYGRNDLWITNKVLRFKSMLDDIEKNGIKEKPIILNRPIQPNVYNSDYEIWEGHHRLAIAKYLNIKPKVKLCQIG